MTHNISRTRHLVVVLGDQLDPQSPIFEGFDLESDAVWMAEVAEEAEHVISHKARIALFLSAMRHFRENLRAKQITVHYRELDDPHNSGSLDGEFAKAIQAHQPEKIRMVHPGEWRVQQRLKKACSDANTPLDILPDTHFLCSLEEFAAHAKGRKQLRLEYFYREMRRKTGILMDGNEPEGGKWNFDAQNRRSFTRSGPEPLKAPRRFPQSALTQSVLELVAKQFPSHPGHLEHFDWPVTPEDAQSALDDFVQHRLGLFGDYQDAMWSNQPYLYHSRLSVALNLKLLDPRQVLKAAEDAYYRGQAPLNSVEGFIRQVLGWREYMRGIY